MNDSSNEPATDDSNDGLNIELATGLMIAVTATGVLKGANDETKRHAGKVLESELEMFRAGEGQYGVNHERVAAGDMREADSVVVLVSKCAEKIALFKGAGLGARAHHSTSPRRGRPRPPTGERRHWRPAQKPESRWPKQLWSAPRHFVEFFD